MSEEGGFGVALAERFFGLLMLVIGSVALYYVFTSTDALAGFSGFFGFLNILIMAVGLFLITAKTE